MPEKPSLLYSEYIIDGVSQPLTPAQMLQECSQEGAVPPLGEREPGVIADETVDPSAVPHDFAFSNLLAYTEAIAALGKRPFPVAFSAPYTCGKVAQALLDTIWQGGHFRLGDLVLKADWHWDDREIGRMAAFFGSVEAACDYIDGLGIRLGEVQVSRGACSVQFKAITTLEEDDQPGEEEESLIRELPFRTAHPRISRRRKCPSQILPDKSDWLIYIPFDTCPYRLGGSVLSDAVGAALPVAPDIGDADYFIDCFEVVRELVEDGVVKAGVTVFQGGLMTALQKMSLSCGARVSVGGLLKGTGETDPVRVLFGEVPGIVIQIADIDYDYLDAELLLQDVAYYPIGHPSPETFGVRVSGESSDVSLILESLMNTLEGED